ncbi:MAG: holin [Clostridia bacterium]|nr:holin [Clostridia bacterium]
MKTDYTFIFELIITLISALISCFLIPQLKNRLSEEKREQLLYWTEVAVKAAEQLYGSKTGQQKKEYVVSFLLSKGIVFDIDEVTALIESEVYRLTSESKEQNK